MANDVRFEGKERRMAKIEKCLAEYGIASLEDAKALCESNGIDVEGIVKGVQPIAFENAVWAYTLGVALAMALRSSCGSAGTRRSLISSSSTGMRASHIAASSRAISFISGSLSPIISLASSKPSRHWMYSLRAFMMSLKSLYSLVSLT